MAYKMEINGRTIYLAQKALSDEGDYIVYEWNDGVFVDDDEDDWYEDDDLEEDIAEDDFDGDEENEDDDEDEVEIELGEDEDEVEEAVRIDIETILSSGFIPQGGVSSFMTPEYTTCYTQAFFRKK